MAKKTLALMFLVVIVALLTSCVEKEKIKDNIPLYDQTQDVDLRSYFPAAEGAIYRYAGKGNEYAAFIREVKFSEGSRVQIHDNNGGTIIASVYQLGKDEIALLTKQPEFYENTNIIAKAGDKPQDIILKAPLKAGTSWESDEWKREIAAVDEKVTVPAGTFYHVVKVKLIAKKSTESNETYEFYAQNVGLVARETIIEKSKIASQLFSYGVKEKNQTGEENSLKGAATTTRLAQPNLLLLAYQLDHQLRSTFESAYESYINLGKITQYSQNNFNQLIQSYQEQIDHLAVKEIVDEQLKRLRQYYSAGEGEVTFPTHEMVNMAKLVSETPTTAKVILTVTKYYPAREWSGKAYNQTTDYTIDLVKVQDRWKLQRVDVAE